MKKVLTISGMTCPACSALIEDICGDFSQITSSKITDSKLTLEYSDEFNIEDLISEIEKAGNYTVR